MKWKKKMTDKIIISRKEIEALQRWQDDEEIANNCYEDDDGCFILYDDLRALLDKAEVVSGEAVGEIKIYWGSDTGYEYGLTLIGGALGSQKEYDEWIVKNFNGEGVFKLYTTPQPSRIKEIAELQAREKVLVEAISSSLNWANGRQAEWGTRAEKSFEFLEQALANVIGEVK